MSETFLSLGADARGLLEALRSSTQALTQASNTMLGMAANLETVQSELDQTKVKLAQAAAVAKEVSLTYAGLSKAIYSGGEAATFARKSLEQMTTQSQKAVAALGSLSWIQERQLRNAQVNIGITQAANAEFQKQVSILAEVAALRNTTIQQLRAETQAITVRNAAVLEINALDKQLKAAQVEAVALGDAKVQALMREVAAQKALNAERRASIIGAPTKGPTPEATSPRDVAAAKEVSLAYAALSKAIYSGGEAATFARKSLKDLTTQSKQAVAALGALSWTQERQLRNAQVNIGVTQAANAEFQKQVSILAEVAALRNTTIQQIRAETQAVAVRNAATLETNSLYKQLQAAQAEAVALSNANVQAMMREVAAQKALNAERRASILHTGAYAGGPVGITTDPRLTVGTHTKASATELASLNAHYAKLEKGTRAATKETGKFKDALGQLRATARGTSGALGGLWLTYAQTAGQMATMVAAFTAASAAVASVRFGAQMGRELAFIQGASEESAEAIAHVNQQILSMASTDSLQGPRELANGLRILVQAGFDTRESLSMLRPLMELTVGGEIDIAKGADTLQKAIHAFNLSVADAPMVVDQLGKAAAISATNVEEMSSALTSAASIGKLYGQNLTDTLTMLGILSSGGIKGSAAGTALTNMMRELDGRTEEARLTLKALNIEVADSTGAWKPALDVIKEMTVKLKELSPKAFADFVEMSQNLRGARSFAVIADALRRATDEATNMGEAIKNAEGFMGRLYELVSKTTSGEFDQFAASLEAALVTAFQQSEPAIRDVVASLKDLARSPEFREFLASSISGLTTMISFAADFARKLAEIGMTAGMGQVLDWVKSMAGAIGDLGSKLESSGLLNSFFKMISTPARFAMSGGPVGALVRADLNHRAQQREVNRPQVVNLGQESLSFGAFNYQATPGLSTSELLSSWSAAAQPFLHTAPETHGTKTLSDLGILSGDERAAAEKRLRAELDAAVRWYDIQRKAIEKREARLEESSKFELSLLDANLQAQLMSVEEFDAKKRAIERKNLTDHILNVKAQQLLLEQELPKAKAFAEKYPTSSQAKSRVDKLIAEQEQLTGEIERATNELTLFDETSKSLDIAKFLELRKALADVVTEGIRAREAIDFEASLATLDDGTADYLRTLEELKVAHEEELAAIVASNEQVDARVLIANKAYQDAVENAKYAEAEKLRLQGDWLAGATKGLNQYRAEIKDTFSVARDVAYQTFKQLEDGMVEMLTDWENGFRSFGETLKNIFQMIWAEVNRVMIVRPLIGAILGTGTTATGVSAATGAQGGGFSPAGLGNLFSGTGWGGLQANLSATLLDTFGMEGASQWVMDANPGMLGSGLAGLGTFAMGLLSGQNVGQSAAGGLGAFLGGLTPLGPIGSALGGMLGNWIGGSLFGDDLKRGYLDRNYTIDYQPGSGWAQTDMVETREKRNGEDFREMSQAIADVLTGSLNTLTGAFGSLFSAAGADQSWQDFLDSFTAAAAGSRSYTDIDRLTGTAGIDSSVVLGAYISGEDEDEIKRSAENIYKAIVKDIIAPFVSGSIELLRPELDAEMEGLDLSMFTADAAGKITDRLQAALDLMEIGDITDEASLQRELGEIEAGLAGIQEVFGYVGQVAALQNEWQDIIDKDVMSDAEYSMKQLEKWYTEQKNLAEQLGLELGVLNEAYRVQAEAIAEELAARQEGVTGSWQDIIDQNTLGEWELARKNLAKWYEEETAKAEELGLSTELLTRAYGVQLDKISESEAEQALAAMAAQMEEAAAEAKRWDDAIAGVNRTIAGVERDIATWGMTTSKLSGWLTGSIASARAAFSAADDYDEAIAGYQEVEGLILERWRTEQQYARELTTTYQGLFQLVDQIKDKSQSLTYSQYNLALDDRKQASAAADYARLFGLAKTGDADAKSSYLGFVDTYLQTSMDVYKSSPAYQAIYRQVQDDLGRLGVTTLAQGKSAQEEATERIAKAGQETVDELKKLREELGKMKEQVGRLQAQIQVQIDGQEVADVVIDYVNDAASRGAVRVA